MKINRYKIETPPYARGRIEPDENGELCLYEDVVSLEAITESDKARATQAKISTANLVSELEMLKKQYYETLCNHTQIITAQRDVFKRALESIVTRDLGEGGCKRVAREALDTFTCEPHPRNCNDNCPGNIGPEPVDEEPCVCDPAYGVKCACHDDEEDRANRMAARELLNCGAYR